MKKKLITTRVLAGGIRRHTLVGAVDVPEEDYVRAIKKHFTRFGSRSLHLLDCGEIRWISEETSRAIVDVHKRLAKKGRKLVISTGDNPARYLQYNATFAPERVRVCRTEEEAKRELLPGVVKNRKRG